MYLRSSIFYESMRSKVGNILYHEIETCSVEGVTLNIPSRTSLPGYYDSALTSFDSRYTLHLLCEYTILQCLVDFKTPSESEPIMTPIMKTALRQGFHIFQPLLSPEILC